MKLGELYDQLTEYIARHESKKAWGDVRELNVVVGIHNFSAGPSATANVTGYHAGMDWNRDDLFLHTDKPLYHAIPFTREQMKTSMKHTADLIDKIGYLPKMRKHCWEDGYEHGWKCGVQSRFAETHPPVEGEVVDKET